MQMIDWSRDEQAHLIKQIQIIRYVHSFISYIFVMDIDMDETMDQQAKFNGHIKGIT